MPDCRNFYQYLGVRHNPFFWPEVMVYIKKHLIVPSLGKEKQAFSKLAFLLGQKIIEQFGHIVYVLQQFHAKF